MRQSIIYSKEEHGKDNGPYPIEDTDDLFGFLFIHNVVSAEDVILPLLALQNYGLNITVVLRKG